MRKFKDVNDLVNELKTRLPRILRTARVDKKISKVL